jgi:hypothetical protein
MSAPVLSPEPLPPLPPVPQGVAYGVPARPVKQPLVALALSFFLPGMGQVYNGHTAKALVFFAGFVSSIYLTAEVNGMPFAFFIPFALFYSMIDAYRSAGLINARAAGMAATPEEDNAESPVWGAVLVGIGLLILLNNFGWLNLASIQRFWPLLLVAAGVAFLRGALQRKGSGNGSAL